MKPGPKPTKARCGHDAPNFGKGKCRRCYHRDYARATYRKTAWPAHLQRKYGLSVEDFERLVASQEKACAICRRETALHVDHDHATGKVRGLLCGTCNRGLGMFEESEGRLVAAARYIAERKEAA